MLGSSTRVQLGGKELQRGLRLGLLLGVGGDVLGSEEVEQLLGDVEAFPGRHLVDSSTIREPSGYSHISATSRRPNVFGESFSLSTKIGPNTSSSSIVRPAGACSSKKDRWFLENTLLTAPLPATVSRTDVFGTPLSDAEHTYPPGRASTSTTNSGSLRNWAGNSAGTTGRSLTTESSPRPCTRRARATTPALLRSRPGVSRRTPDGSGRRADRHRGRPPPTGTSALAGSA